MALDSNDISRRQQAERNLAAIREAHRVLRAQGHSLDEKDVQALSANPPRPPNFPLLMVIAAGAKDILDALDITGFGVLVTTLLSFLLAIALFIWFLGKMQGGWWKKRALRGVFMRYGITMTLEFIPIVKMVPASTIFVLMTHYQETKVVKLLDQALGILRARGFRR